MKAFGRLILKKVVGPFFPHFLVLAVSAMAPSAEAQGCFGPTCGGSGSGGTTTATSVGDALSCSDAGGDDTYVCTLAPSISSLTNLTFTMKVTTGNTGAATVDVNGLGAKSIKKVQGGVTTDPATNDIRAGAVIVLSYDGTNFQLQSTLGNSTSPGCIDSVGTDAYACTLSPPITAYTTGMIYSFKAGSSNVGGATIAFNGLTATTIVKQEGGQATLIDNDIRSGSVVEVAYDGTYMQLLSASGSALQGARGSTGFVLNRTVTAAGTTGAQTINKAAGTVNFAAAATSIVVTNSVVSTTSIIYTTIRTADTTCTAVKSVVPAAGSFTITLNAGCNAETSVGFFVTN